MATTSRTSTAPRSRPSSPSYRLRTSRYARSPRKGVHSDRPLRACWLDRGDGQYKAPHQLVEYSPTIFDTSMDDDDREHRPDAADPMAPDQQRARDVASDVVQIMRTTKGSNCVLA